MNAAKELMKIINGETAPNKPHPYDRQGVVKRVEGKTAYVKINGSKTETPVQLTIACEPGDTVQIRVAGKSAWIVGNHTAPPTDDKVAREAHRIAVSTKAKTAKMGEQINGIGLMVDEQGEQIGYAIESANGKNTIYHSATEPTGGAYKEGDTWFDTDDDNRIYKWDGTQWSAVLLGDDALESISANKITAGEIDASQITVSNLDAGNITTGQLAAARINTAGLQIGITNVNGLEQALAQADGNAWYTGTVMTYTDTTARIYSNSGISDAAVGDMYLNTNTGNVYKCTVGGNASTAKWIYSTSIQGADGDDGNGISSISLYSTSGKNKTYRIYYTDGTYYDYTVKDGADGTDVTSQYVTYIDSTNGVRVHKASDNSNYAQVNANGLQVYQNGNSAAEFGSTARIGKTGSSDYNLLVDSNNFKFRKGTTNLGVIGANNGVTYLYSLGDSLLLSLYDTRRDQGIEMKAPTSSSYTMGTLEVRNGSTSGDGNYIKLNQNGQVSIAARDGSGSEATVSVLCSEMLVGGTIKQNANQVTDKSMFDKGSTSGISVSAGSYVDSTITFNKTFSTAPMVVANFMTNSTDGNFGKCCCAVLTNSITETQFKVRIYNGDSTGRTPRISWIAVGI